MICQDAEFMFRYHLDRYIEQKKIPASGHRWRIVWTDDIDTPTLNVFKRELYLSQSHIWSMTEQEVRRLLRHMMAHICTWHMYKTIGHTPEFNRVCDSMRVNPDPSGCMVSEPRY